MTIKDPVAFAAGFWNWAILDGCFGETKIMPTDLEGFVERKGKFLILETKAPGVRLRLGQKITFQRLVDTGYFVVLVIWGQTNKPKEIMTMTTKGETLHQDADVNLLRNFVSRWFEWADNGGSNEKNMDQD